MSRRLRLARRTDEGFTLVEVMAAMLVFAVIATGATAMFASGLRASLLTKMDTTAKNLSQQRFEAIKNLPFHMDQSATGTNPPDLLDTYFVNATGTVGRGAAGFVPTGGTRYTVDGDPATGAFYRYVQTQVPGFPKFKQYVATQFLDETGAPYNPVGFNSQVNGLDSPPTLSVGVSVTTLWNAGTMARSLRAYTQITSGRPAAPFAVLQSRMTALRLSGGLFGGQTLSLDLASLTADGSLAQTVSGAQALRGATLSLSGGASVDGAASNAKAPPNSGPFSAASGPHSLIDAGVTWATVGSTTTGNVSASSSTGQAVLNTTGSRSRADLLGAGAGSNVATFAVDDTAPARLGLLDTHAYVLDAGCGGGCSNVGVTGYANTASTSTSKSTTTFASATVTGTLALLPTTFAPGGLVRITLSSASVSCSVTHSGSSNPVAAASIVYSGTLKYYAPFAVGNVAGYVTVPLASTQATSPLTAALLSATQVGTDTSGNPLWLSDYFSSWSSLDTGSVTSAKTIATDGTTAAASFSGMIGVTTVPLRTGDDTSAIGAQLGVGACSAEDHR